MKDATQHSGSHTPLTVPADLAGITHQKTVSQASDTAAEAAWMKTLRAECERTSQARVARRLGISPSTVNQVLNGVYKADTARVEALVRGELMNETVQCPVLGELSKRKCVDYQAQPFAATNPQRVALYKACRHSCPHSAICED